MKIDNESSCEMEIESSFSIKDISVCNEHNIKLEY